MKRVPTEWRRRGRGYLIRMILAVMIAASSLYTAYGAEGYASVGITYRAVGYSGNAESVFQLKAADDSSPMPVSSSEGVSRIRLKAGEEGTFEAIALPDPGIYTYEVDRLGSPEGVTKADESVYGVQITVLANGEVTQVIDKGGEKVESILYTDHYEKPAIVATGDAGSLGLPAACGLAALLLLLVIRRKGRQQKLHRISLLTAAMIILSSTVPSFAGTDGLTVIYGDYSKLPANYAHISNLPLKDAEFQTTIGSVKKYYGYVGNNQTEKRDFISYYGPVNYGARNRSADTDASTALNSMDGTITLRWKGAARLSDDTLADVKVTISNWSFRLGKSTNSKITNSTNVYVPILQGSAQGKGTELCASSPRTKMIYNDGTTSTSLSGAMVKTKCRVQFELLQAGTDIPIDASKYPTMLFGFRDLDVEDCGVASGKSAAAQYNSDYSEGVELISGFQSPVTLAPKTSTNPAMMTLVRTSSVNGNLRISGDGAKIEDYNKATGTSGDSATYYSGFIAPVTPQKFSVNWTGSIGVSGSVMGTALGSQPTVAVRASKDEGGSIEKEGMTTYVINSSTTYDYAPDDGYVVQRLTVDGKDVAFEPDGGTYTFDNLYSRPILDRNSTSGVSTSAAKVYTIDVSFARNQFDIHTSVVHGTIDPGKTVGAGEDAAIHYKPDEGYQLNRITVDGEPVDIGEYPSEYVFEDVSEDHEIEVIYDEIPSFDVQKTADLKYVRPGQTIHYTVTAGQNNSSTPGGELMLSDDMAGGLLCLDPDSLQVDTEDDYELVSADADGYSLRFRTVEGANHRISIEYDATVNTEKYISGKITNTVGGASWTVTPVADVTVRNVVTGSLGDREREFEYSIEFTGLDPKVEYENEEILSAETGTVTDGGFRADPSGEAKLLFRLASEEATVFPNIPVGATYRVNEEKSDHIASYMQGADGPKPVFECIREWNNDAEQSLTTKNETLESGDGNITVTYSNERNLPVVTGVSDMRRPTGLLLLVTALFFGSWFAVSGWNRKKHSAF